MSRKRALFSPYPQEIDFIIMNFNDAIDRWLEWKEYNQGRSPETIVKYRGHLVRLARFMEKENDGTDPLEATRDQLEQFTGLWAHQQGQSPRSRRVIVAAIRGFYQWARQSGVIRSNPAEQLETPSAGLRLPVPASLATLEGLIMAPDISLMTGVRDAAIIALLAGTGIRVSGLVALNESSLLWYQDDKGREQLIIKVTEKGKKERLVPVPGEARLLLRAYLGHPDLKEIDRSLPNSDQVLFVSIRNRHVQLQDYHGEARRYSDRSLDDMLKRYGQQCGLPEDQMHAHALRHLFGTELSEDDVQLHEIQALMGHSDPKTTTIYISLAQRKLANVVDRSGPLRKIRTPVTELLNRIDNI